MGFPESLEDTPLLTKKPCQVGWRRGVKNRKCVTRLISPVPQAKNFLILFPYTNTSHPERLPRAREYQLKKLSLGYTFLFTVQLLTCKLICSDPLLLVLLFLFRLWPSGSTQLGFIPACKHFLNRQNWQLFRVRMLIRQFLSLRQANAAKRLDDISTLDFFSTKLQLHTFQNSLVKAILL